MTDKTDPQDPVSYVPHVGWLSHQRNEELITLLHRGCFEAAEQAFFWLYLRPGDCFIDCGAHIGLFSAIASQATKGKIDLIAVEADPKTFSYLKENVERAGLESATLVNAAVWNRPGKIGFVDAGFGKAAYSHVAFDDSTATLKDVQTVTLDEIVSAVSIPQITLIKIDVEGAEPEVLSGGAQVIAEKRCPLIMIEFTEANLARRGVTSIQLARQLKSFGYELCEFSAEALELLPFQVEEPVWYKNLFACINRSAVNARLASAHSDNMQVARDILERANACSLYAELEELHTYKALASAATEATDRAERAEGRVVQEQEKTRQMREWAERTEQLLLQERQTGTQLRQWAEKAEERVAQEQENTRQMREWAERTEQFLLQERQTGTQLRQWAENAEGRVTQEQENTRQMREWGERTELLLMQERERNTLLENELSPLKSFAQRVKWLYYLYRRLRRGV